MPIRPEMRDKYPPDWPDISRRQKEAAGWRCACYGECGRPPAHLAGDRRCPNRHGEPARETGSQVVLTTAHLNHDPTDNSDGNLRPMCNGCHLHYDRDHHAETRRKTRLAAELAAGQEGLF